jgi:hypothetical protein
VIGRPTQLKHPASTCDCGVSMAMPDKQAGCRGRAGKGAAFHNLSKITPWIFRLANSK